MTNINSFLSEGFLKEFVETFPRDFFADEFLASVALYRFLERHTDLTLSGKKEDYAHLVKTDGLVRNTIDRYLQGDDSVKFQDWEKDALPSNAKLFSFFFLTSSKSELSFQLTQKGLPNYQLTNTQTLKQITGYEAITVTKNHDFSNRLGSWSHLKEKLLPFHSLVIVDNYLFANPWQSKATIDMVEAILEMPNFAHITFIYFEDRYKDRGKVNKTHTWKEIKTLLKDSQILEHPEKISVVKLNSSSDFHDRVLITNSQFLTSGNSFNNFFYPDGTIKLNCPTILNLNSHACIYNDTKWSEIAVQMLKTLKKLIEPEPLSTKPTIQLGDPFKNPLLS